MLPGVQARRIFPGQRDLGAIGHSLVTGLPGACVCGEQVTQKRPCPPEFPTLRNTAPFPSEHNSPLPTHGGPGESGVAFTTLPKSLWPLGLAQTRPQLARQARSWGAWCPQGEGRCLEIRALCRRPRGLGTPPGPHLCGPPTPGPQYPFQICGSQKLLFGSCPDNPFETLQMPTHREAPHFPPWGPGAWDHTTERGTES